MASPLVSALIITYRHGHLLKDCLRGALEQNVSFGYEIVVANDASDDETDQIISGFQDSHPKGHLIRHIRQRTNLGLMGNYMSAFQECRGTYIAVCEGDDFWIDESKIARQTAILEMHPDVYMCTHECFYREWPVAHRTSLRESAGILLRDAMLYGYKRTLEQLGIWLRDREAFARLKRAAADKPRTTLLDLSFISNHGFYPASPSILMRRALLDPVPNVFRDADGHHHLSILLATLEAPIWHMSDIFAVKRDCAQSFTKDSMRKRHNRNRSMNVETNEKIKRYTALLNLAKGPSQRNDLERMIEREKRTISVLRTSRKG